MQKIATFFGVNGCYVHIEYNKEINMNFQKYLIYEQDGKKYNLYNLPKGFVIKNDIDISGKNLRRLPDLSDVEVRKSFDCSNNNLTSLKGAPKKVGGAFNCAKNKLTSLEGAPVIVGGMFLCWQNELTSLAGGPKQVGGSYFCENNKLISLEGAPDKINRNFSCSNNLLTSLKGAPLSVGKIFSCENNKLESLDGAPKRIGLAFFYDKKKFLVKNVWKKIKNKIINMAFFKNIYN